MLVKHYIEHYAALEFALYSKKTCTFYAVYIIREKSVNSHSYPEAYGNESIPFIFIVFVSRDETLGTFSLSSLVDFAQARYHRKELNQYNVSLIYRTKQLFTAITISTFELNLIYTS